MNDEPPMEGGSVSILFLSWNSRDEIVDGVRAALAQTHPETEVLVLDNASEDGTRELLADAFSDEVRLICYEDNLGYTGGYNRGLLLARGEFVLLLNPDVRLAPDYLERALPAFDDPRVGIVAGRLMREDGETVDSTGQFLARSRRTIDRGFGARFDAARDVAGPVLSACGAAALYRREMLEDIADGDDVFDADYFAFHEDLELGQRAWRAGWRAVHVPEATATHLRAGGRRAGRLGLTFERSPAVIAHIVKNRHLTMLRHDSVASLLVDLPFVLARELRTFGALLLFQREALSQLRSHSEAYGRARERRRRDRDRRGRWGPWKQASPPRGVWRGEAS